MSQANIHLQLKKVGSEPEEVLMEATNNQACCLFVSHLCLITDGCDLCPVSCVCIFGILNHYAAT